MLAEWYTEQRLRDIRAYRFIITQYVKDPPEAGKIFPFLAVPELHPTVSDAEELTQDDMIFHSVTASLATPSKG